MKYIVNWSDIGSPGTPGEYPFRDGTVTIRESNIADAQAHPDEDPVVAIVDAGHQQDRNAYIVGMFR